MKALERDDLLLSGLIEPAKEPREYRYIGQPKTFHSFVDWGKEQFQQPANPKRRFLPGSFLIEYPRRLGGRKRLRELMETPEALGLRLDNPRGPCCEFNLAYAVQEFGRQARPAP